MIQHAHRQLAGLTGRLQRSWTLTYASSRQLPHRARPKHLAVIRKDDRADVNPTTRMRVATADFESDVVMDEKDPIQTIVLPTVAVGSLVFVIAVAMTQL